jgi:tetratricopeptide (TPR) repeat protein
MTNATQANQNQADRSGSSWLEYRPLVIQLGLLILASFVAYANAWPDVLVLDDKFFAGSDRFSGFQDIPRFFGQDVWATAGTNTGLYRPVLLISLFLDSLLFGDWFAGYHLSNILLHGLAVLAVFGLTRQVLRTTGSSSSSGGWYAFLAALVFAVHPVHTEAVNSIFNRAEILVALFGAGGLWWWLHNLKDRPVRAWSGLALAYLVAMFAKESAIVLPGIAFAWVLILAGGSWLGRLKAALPVLFLLIPLALYLVLRTEALAPPEGQGGAGAPRDFTALSQPAPEAWGGDRQPRASQRDYPVAYRWLRVGGRLILGTAGYYGQALKVMVWPYPLKLFYEQPPISHQIAALVLQLALMCAALLAMWRKRYGLITGLAFFYIAMLPASRFVGVAGYVPEMAERYLYFPSIGLAILLAFALRFLAQKFAYSLVLVPVLLAVLVMTPMSLARNAEWKDEATLFENEYRRGSHGEEALYAVTTARLQQRDFAGAAELCDNHFEAQWSSGKLSNNCGLAYGVIGRTEEAESALLFATSQRKGKILAHNNLAALYLRLGRKDDAEEQLEMAIRSERNPALRAFREGKKVLLLYPKNRTKLFEAKRHFEEALRLQPGLIPAQQWLENINQRLESPRRAGRSEPDQD